MVPKDCSFCPRLVAFREANALKFPALYNGAVPAFGDLQSRMLVVGLAPGLKGANATGRPFTGDYAGDILYASLGRNGLASGVYDKRADDGLELIDVRITNAVRCVPPENKPLPEEAKACNGFLHHEIAGMPNLKLILTLGNVSHGAVLKALKLKPSLYRFAHGAEHNVLANGRPLIVLNSYHTSRYNIQTRRLSQGMFDAVVSRARSLLGA